MNEQKRFTLRIDAETLNKVKEQAQDNKRSLAKEIEYILEEYLDEKPNKDK